MISMIRLMLMNITCLSCSVTLYFLFHSQLTITSKIYWTTRFMGGSRGGTGGPDPPPEILQKRRVSWQY